jgi:predicted AlkP superfamily phosphohydrolase/phosphomutase
MYKLQKSNRVLIIGLDGGTWDVLDPWMKDGSLPNLAKLRQQGSWGELLSTVPPLTAPAWSTFITGKNPGKHSVFHFVQADSSNNNGGATEPDIVNSRSIKSATLWDILGHHDRKVGLINIPMSYPPRPVNGFMIACFLTPRNAPVFTYPPELSNRLTDYQIDLDRFISHKPFARDSEDPPNVEPSLELMQEFYTMEEKRARTALTLMKTEPWDTFMVVFTATDRMGHYLWPYHREIDSDGSPEWEQLHEAIFRFYIRLDKAIGEMVQEAGDDATVIIMSDHGMGWNHTKLVYWNLWLYQKGLLTVQSNVTNPDSWLMQLKLPRDRIARLVRRVAPGSIRRKLIQKANATQILTFNSHQTRAYYKPIYGSVGGIYINLTGEAKNRLRDELMQAVKQVIDPATGQPVVQWVERGEVYYHGPYTQNMPDIVLVMDWHYAGDSKLSHYSSVVTELQLDKVKYPGDHRMEGLFLAKGPEIETIADPLPNLNLQDIAPTILYLLGLPIPADMDGRVLSEALKPAVLQSRPVVQEMPKGMWPTDQVGQAFDSTDDASSDDETVKDRLRALGYLE